MFYLWTIAHEV